MVENKIMVAEIFERRTAPRSTLFIIYYLLFFIYYLIRDDNYDFHRNRRPVRGR